MTTSIPIDLGLADIEVLSVRTDGNGDYHIKIRSTLKEGECHVCGKRITKHHGHDREIKIRHLSILGKACYLYIKLPRFQCLHCRQRPTTTQQPSWRNRKSAYTRDYEQHILRSLMGSTLSDVSRQEYIQEGCISRILERYQDSEIDWCTIEHIGQLGIDEISLKKGHKDFVTIVSCRVGDTKRVLAVLEGRKKATVMDFLGSIPKAQKRTILSVCSDLYEGFINAAKEVLGKSIMIVIDRFHVAKLYRKGLDTLRKREMKRLKKELNDTDYKKLKGVMWDLRKSEANLSKKEKMRLSELFKHSELLKEGYQLSTKLTKLFNTPTTRAGGIRRLKNWMNAVQASNVSCFNTFLGTLEKWITEVANYFVSRENSGFVEGLNNRIKVIKRRCYGIVDRDHLFKRISLDLGVTLSFL